MIWSLLPFPALFFNHNELKSSHSLTNPLGYDMNSVCNLNHYPKLPFASQDGRHY